MKVVHLRVSADKARMSASLVSSPAASADLAITEVPDDVALTALITLANRTIINLPARPKVMPSVAYSSLGEGKFINLATGGRPAGSTTSDRTATIPPTRCTPEQRETWDELGGVDWLRATLDAATRRK